MLLEAAILAAVAFEDMNFNELRNYFWDCETLKVSGQVQPHHVEPCKRIDESMRKMFFTEHIFVQYWDIHKETEWAKRGYKGHQH